MSARSSGRWMPEDVDRIVADVAAIPAIQQRLLANASKTMKFADRVAHQYQIAGGRVSLTMGTELPENLDGVGLFRPGSEYTGIGRISTGLGCPHAELRVHKRGRRVVRQNRLPALRVGH